MIVSLPLIKSVLPRLAKSVFLPLVLSAGMLEAASQKMMQLFKRKLMDQAQQH